MAKARRGELQIRLPVGFVYDAAGKVQLDPDRQVQHAVRALFATFARTGSAGITARTVAEQGMHFPCRPPHGPRMGELVWNELTYSRALEVLHNPRYAGVYALGRTRQRKLGSGRRTTRKLERTQWSVLLRDQHPGYISWDDFEENQRRLTLRWGSYLAVLLDHDKPIWREVESPSTSRISDDEMARINIEASAALAEWIDIYRADPGGRIFEQLVNRAVAYLPMPKKTSKLKVTEFGALSEPEMAARLVEAFRASDALRVEQVRADVERHPSRVLANALVNSGWRNGPVENIHAGDFHGYPLDQRRVTLAEERELMSFASERLAQGTSVCLRFSLERRQRPWPEQVLPYGLAEHMMITPSRWTLTEASRDVRLPATVSLAAPT